MYIYIRMYRHILDVPKAADMQIEILKFLYIYTYVPADFRFGEWS